MPSVSERINKTGDQEHFKQCLVMLLSELFQFRDQA